MTRLSYLWLILVSCIGATVSANNFNAVEKYMRDWYIRGWHNSNYLPASHETFLEDFESNQLFSDFKIALQAGDQKAKKVFDVVLSELRHCLVKEKEYGPRVQKRLRNFMGSVGVFFLLIAPFGKNKAIKAELLTGFVLFSGIAYFSHYLSELEKNPEALEKAKKEAWWGRLLDEGGRKGKYERVIDDLEKRIGVWSQMLPAKLL